MDEFLKLLKNAPQDADLYGFVTSMVLSFVASIAIALLYATFYENRRHGAHVHRFFLVGGPSVTAMLLAIQFSLPLSLGLLGALSFVRFRTPVKEPEEMAYLILLIGASITCATFNFFLTAILIGLAIVAIVVQRLAGLLGRRRRQRGVLLISFREEQAPAAAPILEEALKSCVSSYKLESMSASEGLTSYHFSIAAGSCAKLAQALGGLRERLHAEKLSLFSEE